MVKIHYLILKLNLLASKLVHKLELLQLLMILKWEFEFIFEFFHVKRGQFSILEIYRKKSILFHFTRISLYTIFSEKTKSCKVRATCTSPNGYMQDRGNFRAITMFIITRCVIWFKYLVSFVDFDITYGYFRNFWFEKKNCLIILLLSTQNQVPNNV